MVTRTKLFASLCVLAVLAACSSPQPRTKSGISDESFVIAGGQTVSIPMTNAGPISIENEYAKILVAGFVIGPSKGNEKHAILAWGFDFEIKPTIKKLEAVKVEEVAPSTSAVILVEDNSPVLKGGVWSGNASPIPANRTSTPWLFTSDKSIYVFRFTIKPVGAPAFVLYQPAWFTGAAKRSFQEMIAHVEQG